MSQGREGADCTVFRNVTVISPHDSGSGDIVGLWTSSLCGHGIILGSYV